MTDNKRYQVFLSSTFTDLVEARAEVIQALLELDCMPAGMELFPAANDDQWNWIKRVIAESDYYVVIVAGRYGSVSKATALSYTEMEYRYAIEIGKPTIALLHQDPSSISAKYSESSQEGREKLAAFRELAQRKLCKFWTTPADLGAKVSRSLTQLIRQHPSIGWVRSDQLSRETASEVLQLRRQVDELENRLQSIGETPPEGAAALAGGGDSFSIHFAYETKVPKESKAGNTYYVKGSDETSSLATSWDQLFATLAPHMIEPIRKYQLTELINDYLLAHATPVFRRRHGDMRIDSLKIYRNDLNTILIQLRALGLIALNDDAWFLTPYGDNHMNRLLAVPKKQVAKPRHKGAQ